MEDPASVASDLGGFNDIVLGTTSGVHPEAKAVIGENSIAMWQLEQALSVKGLAPAVVQCPIAIERGEGVHLWDFDGRRYVDFSAGNMTQSTGHSHPHVIDAVTKQFSQLANAHDSPTRHRGPFLSRLAALCRGEFRFEMHSGGSETMEAARRVVIAATSRTQFVSFHRGYHGNTLGSRSLSPWILRGYGPVQPEIRVPFPYCYRCPIRLSHPTCNLQCVNLFEDAIEGGSFDHPTALVVEPIQGAAGIVVPPEGYWPRVMQIARRRGLLVVADEILTGVGRCGSFLASHRLGIDPDVVCFGKGLGSGYPVMVMGARPELADAVPFSLPGEATTTFGGNPVAAAAGLATLEVIERENLMESAERIGVHMLERLRSIADSHRLVGDVRGLGLAIGIEHVRDRETKEPAHEEGARIVIECLKRGLRLMNANYLVRMTPPLTLSVETADEALDIYEEALDVVEKLRIRA